MKRRNFLKFSAGLPALALFPSFAEAEPVSCMVWTTKDGWLQARYLFLWRGQRHGVGHLSFGEPTKGRAYIEAQLRRAGRCMIRGMNVSLH